MSYVLITGGCGYIGIHTALKLIEENYEVILFDNFSNSSKNILQSIKSITKKNILIIEGDIRNKHDLQNVFLNYDIGSIIHFAACKSVDESIIDPKKYYDNNVLGTINLINEMDKYNVRKIVFSSSATVYGDKNIPPLNEKITDLNPINPYGKSKLIIENYLQDLCDSDPRWSALSLRYFNPVGAHKSGLVGEDLDQNPSNLMPNILNKIAMQKTLTVYGGDYDTKDGSCIRDYIHIDDLAEGHILALKKCQKESYSGVINLGTGKGYTVIDVLTTFMKVNEVNINFKIGKRRRGDVVSSFADVSKAKKDLGWQAKYGLEEMCEDSWMWYQNYKKLSK